MGLYGSISHPLTISVPLQDQGSTDPKLILLHSAGCYTNVEHLKLSSLTVVGLNLCLHLPKDLSQASN